MNVIRFFLFCLRIETEFPWSIMARFHSTVYNKKGVVFIVSLSTAILAVIEEKTNKVHRRNRTFGIRKKCERKKAVEDKMNKTNCTFSREKKYL